MNVRIGKDAEPFICESEEKILCPFGNLRVLKSAGRLFVNRGRFNKGRAIEETLGVDSFGRYLVEDRRLVEILRDDIARKLAT